MAISRNNSAGYYVCRYGANVRARASRQLIEQRLGLFLDRRVAFFGEPAVDRREEISSRSRLNTRRKFSRRPSARCRFRNLPAVSKALPLGSALRPQAVTPIVFSSAIMTSSNVTGWKTGPSRKQDPFSSGQFVTGYTCKLAACKLTSISLYP